MENLEKYDIVLSPLYLKEELISLKLTSFAYNFKIIDKNTLIEHLCFSYDDRAILYLFRKGIRFENCREIIRSMFFIDENTAKDINEKLEYHIFNDNPALEYHNFKIDNLLKYKEELIKLNYLSENKLYRNFYKNKKILVKGYDPNDKTILLLKDRYSLDITFDNECLSKQLEVKVFENLELEMRYLFENIFKLYLDEKNNVPLNKIKVVAENETYISLLKKYQNFYNLHFNFESDLTYYNSSEYKDFKNILSTTIVDQAFVFAYDKYKDSSYLEKLLQKYIEVKDVIKDEEILPYLDFTAKNIKLKADRYLNGIDIISLNEAHEDDHVFLVGFNLNSYPHIHKDADYLLDKEKEIIGISTSFEEQIFEEKELISQLYRCKNLYISFSSSYRGEKFFPSLLVEKLGIKEVKDYRFEEMIYSSRHFNYYMGMLYDDERNFSYHSKYLESTSKEQLKYLSYENAYKNFIIPSLKKPLKLSYSAIQTFYECPFKYYLTRICKADEYKDTVTTILGNMTHKIFEDYIKGQPKDYEYYVDSTDVNAAERFVLLQNKEAVEYALERFKLFCEKTSLNVLVSESDEFYYKDSNDDILLGKVDLVMSNESNYAIIDFKTGYPSLNKDKIYKGLDMQLPIYYVLVNADNEGFGKKTISGIYYYHIIDGAFYKKDYSYLLLDGITVTESDFNIVQGNDSFINKRKPFGKKEFDDMINAVIDNFEKACERIHNADFVIRPAEEKKCKECPFIDTCFKDIQDDEDESEDGGE